MRNVGSITTVLLSVLLAACLLPENFVARAVVDDKGGYTFNYDGLLAFPLALMADKQGRLGHKDDVELQQEAIKLAKIPGYRSVTYKGHGRFQVSFQRHYAAGEPMVFPSAEDRFFSIVPGRAGLLTISSIAVSPKDLAQLEQLGAHVEGDLKVSVARGSTVISQNAQSVPSFFGLFGDYEWHIHSPAAAPAIAVRTGR